MEFFNMQEILVPIFAIMMPVAIVFTVFYFRNKSREDMQKTIRLAIEKGQPLPPELIDSMNRNGGYRSRERSIYSGLVLLAIGASFIVWSYLDDGYIHGGKAGFGVLLALLGVASLIYGIFIVKSQK